jgi:ergothioneine biosynthesis protein EgtB
MAQALAPSAPVAGLDRYRDVRALTEALARRLSAEDQTVQSMPDVSPTKWHRAHTTWFFETFLLQPAAPGYRLYDDRFGFLFNSYYDTVGPRYARDRRGLISRPGAAEVGRYRAHVDEALAAFAADGLPPELDAVMALGCHHEEQHQELLLMDIKHVLSANPMRPAYVNRPPAAAPGWTPGTAPGWLSHDGGLVETGHGGGGFGFDNEFPRHRVFLQPFQLSSHLVTNTRWLEFMADGGYRRPELWLSEGWATVNAEGWSAPLYWEQDDGVWQQFTLNGLRAVDPAEPVCHVSYFEADAFARWAGGRLPTEAEWEAVAATHPVEGNFLDPAVVHPRPPAGGHQALFGDVWQWTSSSYSAYPGYRPDPGALGEYNGKFMANQYVLRGGSAVTPVGHARATYRNFFPAASRWMFAGLRVARDW